MVDVRIQHIIDFVENINDGQICTEPVNDPDLGFPIFGYRDDAGEVHRVLAKDEPIRIQYVDFIADGHSCQPGRLCYDTDTNGLIFGLSNDVSLNVGEEFLFRARNTSGAAISNGAVVALTGATGTNPNIGLADKDTSNPWDVLGVATEEIDSNQFGYTTAAGHVRGLDMSAFSLGDTLWLGDNGGLQNTQPNAPANSVHVGLVLDDHATQGELLARVRPIPKLWELSDVDRSTALSDGDVYAWSTANDRFELTTFLTDADAVTSLDVNGAAGGALQGDLKFYTSAGIIIDKAADGFIFSSLQADTIYLADSLTLTEGTPVSGSVTDTHTVNLVGYVVDETSGAPGYDLRLNYINVNGIDRIQAHVLYDAVTAHTVEIRLYNYSTTSFDAFTTFTASAGYQTIDVPVSDDTNYIDGSGNAIIQFYHTASGNTSHEITHDYVVLVEQTGGGGSSQAVLAESAVGFGSATNVLTGDATNFTYDASTRQLAIGDGTPVYLGTTQDSLYIEGRLEVTSNTYFVGATLFRTYAQMYDDIPLAFGDSLDVRMEWDTNQANPSWMCWVPATASSFSIAPVAAETYNYGMGPQSHPTLVVWSNTAHSALDSNQRVEVSHLGDHARFRTYRGSFEFADEYLLDSTDWTTNTQLLYASSTEVDDIYALLGDAEGSIAAAILAAAASGGGSLDDAYNAGNSITVDGSAVSFSKPSDSTGVVFEVVAFNDASSSDMVQWLNDSQGITLYMSGDIGTDDYTAEGHVIRTEGAGTYKSTFSVTGQTYIHNWANTTFDYTAVTIRAEDDTQAIYSSLAMNSAEGITLQSTDGSINLISAVTGGGITLQGFNEGIEIQSGSVHGASQYVGFASSSAASFASGVIDLDFGTGNQYQRVTATQNVTEIDVTDPDGVGVFYLRITASGGSRSVTNFTSDTSTPFTFIGNYNLNSSSITIPSGEVLEIKMIFHGASLGWDVQVVSEA